MICRVCGAEYPEETKFCPGCAAVTEVHGIDTETPAPGYGRFQAATPEQGPAPEQEPAPEPGSAPEPGPAPESEPVIEREPAPEPGSAPEQKPATAPARDLLSYDEPVSLPGFLKKYHLEKTIINAVICFMSLIIFIVIAAGQVKLSSAAGFSSYAELERLYDEGRKTVKISNYPIRTINLDWLPISDNDYAFSTGPTRNHGIIELPDGIVYIVGDYSKYQRGTEPELVVSLESREGALSSLIDERIRYPRLSNVITDQVAEFQRISENVKPILLKPVNVATTRTIAAVFCTIFCVLALIFAVRLFKSGTILVSPGRSKTYRTLAKYGDPIQLIEECADSLGQLRDGLKPREIIINDSFFVSPSPSSVFIAPVSELIWAYLSLVFYISEETYKQMYELVLCFSANDRVTYRVASKNAGIKELNWLKSLNPSMLIGYDDSFQYMYGRDFYGFRDRILSELEKLQDRTAADKLADIRTDVTGLSREFI